MAEGNSNEMSNWPDEVITYWIGRLADGRAVRRGEPVALFFANDGTAGGYAGGSVRRGLFKVWRCRWWARRHGLIGARCRSK